jgi:PAS domain S-box-containing protein
MARRQTLGRQDSEFAGAQTSASDPPIRVLFVGVDRDRFHQIRDRLALSRAPFEIFWITDAAEVLRWMEDSNADVVLIDDSFGTEPGIRLVRETTHRHMAGPPVIVTTAKCDRTIDRAAMDAGAADYLDWHEVTAESLRWTIRFAARHRTALEAARRNAAWFRALVDHGIDGVATLDSNGSLTYVSPSVKRLMGYDDEALIGCHFGGLVHPDDLGAASDAFKRVLSQPGVSVRSKIRVRHANGEWRVQEGSTVNLLDEPAIASIVCHFTDITEHETTQQALGETQELFEAIFAEALDAILISDDDGQFVLVNRAAGELFGIAPEDMIGRMGSEFTPENMDYPTAWRAFLSEGRMSGAHELRRADGTVREVEFAAVANVLPGRHLSILRDVTERKRSEEAFERTAAKLRGLFGSNVVNITFSNREGVLLDANDAFLEMVGRTRADLASGRLTWQSVTPPEFIADNDRAIVDAETSGRCLPFEKQYVRPDGSRVWVLLGVARLPGSGGEFASLSIDITRQKAVEEEFRQAQKMEAVGRLAGGIAHDFNNLLTAILGYAELLSEIETLPTDVREDVENIRTAAVSAAGLTQQLLAFSRRQVLQPRVLSLNEVVSRIEAILRRVLGEDIRLTVDLDPRTATVRGDTVQLEQILLNLAVNARDAMPLGGELTIRTRNRFLDAGYVASHGGATVGPHVELSVSDTGTGMDENVKAHIFEPFFTTKPEGKGTGLGLATVYGAIKQMAGSIGVESELHRGTTFRIYLPAIGCDAIGDEAKPRSESARGRERVLLVEDKEEVRRVASRALQRQGYRVTEAASPREALAIVSEGTHFDLLLTDMVMPEMRGGELAHHLRQRIPSLRIVYMSGYADDTIGPHGEPGVGVVFLQKPFTPHALIQHVRQALDAPRNHEGSQ